MKYAKTRSIITGTVVPARTGPAPVPVFFVVIEFPAFQVVITTATGYPGEEHDGRKNSKYIVFHKYRLQDKNNFFKFFIHPHSFLCRQLPEAIRMRVF